MEWGTFFCTTLSCKDLVAYGSDGLWCPILNKHSLKKQLCVYEGLDWVQWRRDKENGQKDLRLCKALRALNSSSRRPKTLQLKGLSTLSKCKSKRPKIFGSLLVMFLRILSSALMKVGFLSLQCCKNHTIYTFNQRKVGGFYLFILHDICFWCWGWYTRDSTVSWHTFIWEEAKNKHSCWKRSDSCSELN